MSRIEITEEKTFKIDVKFIKRNTKTGEVQMKLDREPCTLTKEQVDIIVARPGLGVDAPEDLLLRWFIKKGIEKTHKVKLEITDIPVGILAHILVDEAR